MYSNVIYYDIELPQLQIGQQTKICCKFNRLEDLNVGKHKIIYEFYVNDKLYGNPLIINIDIKNPPELLKLRKEYQLSKEDYFDEFLIKHLIKQK